MNEYLCEWKPTERDRKMDELAKRYHTECEAYDRTVCTGPVCHGSIMPATYREMALVNLNARSVRKRIEEEARVECITREELAQAICRLA